MRLEESRGARRKVPSAMLRTFPLVIVHVGVTLLPAAIALAGRL